MDTLSSSVSTLKIPSLPPSSSTTTNREFHHFTRTPHASSTPTTRPIPSLIPKKIKTFSHNHHKSSLLFSSSSSSNTSPVKPIFHHNPATGYAAAIIDVAQTTNSLHSVQKDINRLLKFLQSYGIVDQGQAMKKVLEHGNFHGHVVALVKMLMKKNKVGIVEQVLEEFDRIYDELCRTQVVLVSSATKIGEDQLFGIAKSVQQLSGAARVKVKNLVQQRFPTFTSLNHPSKSELYL